MLKAFDTDSAVMSSCVGPIPPVVKTYVNLFLKVFKVSIITFLLSGIILTSFTCTPKEFNHNDKVLVLISLVLP